MKIKPDYVLRRIGDQCLAVPLNDEADRIQGVISLNETGAKIFAMLQDGADEASLVKSLTDTYAVSENVITEDVRSFIEKARNAGILE